MGIQQNIAILELRYLRHTYGQIDSSPTPQMETILKSLIISVREDTPILR